MPEIITREAIRLGLQEALESDDRVFLMGEDIGAYQGSYAVTKGFLEQYGDERIRDCPIAESGIIGAATGAAMAGMRPIVEMMTINFMLLGIDQVVNHAAKLSYMSNGQIQVPLVIRAVTGGGGRLAATHSQNFEGWFASVPGVKVAVPQILTMHLGYSVRLSQTQILLFLLNTQCYMAARVKFLRSLM